jgi:hypothetical protein
MSLFPGINDKARACKRSRAERAKLGQIFTKIQEEECEAKEEQCEGEEDIYSLSTASATQQGLQNPLLSHLMVFH